jgi:hypothetical protein
MVLIDPACGAARQGRLMPYGECRGERGDGSAFRGVRAGQPGEPCGAVGVPVSLLPGPLRIGVRVVGVRGDGAEISGAQVIDTPDQLEFVRIRFIWTHVATAGRLSDGSTWPHDLLVFCLASPGLDDVSIFGLRMRIAPCRGLAHCFLRRWLSAEPMLITCPVRRHLNEGIFRVSGDVPDLPEPVKAPFLCRPSKGDSARVDPGTRGDRLAKISAEILRSASDIVDKPGQTAPPAGHTPEGNGVRAGECSWSR